MEKTNFLEKFSKITGLEVSESIKLLNIEKLSVLILNTLKRTEINFHEYENNPFLQKLEGSEHIYIIKKNKNIFTNDSKFKKGHYYILNASSLLPVIALNPKPNENILDLCSSPGGKSFYISVRTDNKAKLTVNEAEKHRYKNLKEVIKQYSMNVENILLGPGQGLYRVIENKFDKILLDAPCSAEGLISQVSLNEPNPKFWNQQKVKQLRNLQRKLINSAYHMLNEGGELVYSTCTYSPEENEDVIDWLLKTYKDIKLQEIPQIKFSANFVPGLKKWERKLFNKELNKAIRVLPTEIYEGFFVAKLKKVKQ